ncbi:MAG: hypothetical protein IPK13_10140 [Deltaproteobacteria bacterium]|nr:hypothetical protein [Deltaproteobacteria bacterium]
MRASRAGTSFAALRWVGAPGREAGLVAGLLLWALELATKADALASSSVSPSKLDEAGRGSNPQLTP